MSDDTLNYRSDGGSYTEGEDTGSVKRAAAQDKGEDRVVVSVPPEPSDVPKYEAAIAAVKAAQAALVQDADRERLWDKWTRRVRVYPRVALLAALAACAMAAFVTFLIVGAYYGFYVEPLRQFWYIWPAPGAQADATKVLVLWGVAGLAAVVSVSYRRRPAEPPL